MTQADLARRTGLTTKHINQVAKGGSGISPEVALAFERVTEIPARYWLQLDANFQATQYLATEADVLEQQLDIVDCFPVAELIKLGYLPAATSKLDKLKGLLRFFAVANPRALRDVWLQPAMYRLAPTVTNQDGAIAAWLRIAERKSADVHASDFDATACREAIPAMRGLSRLPGQTWIQPLQQLCASVGVVLVFVRELPKCGINGATRWLSPDRAMIVLSGRYKRLDVVWFTLFHELCHLLRHSKKQTFVDRKDSGIDQDLEVEADSFAARTLISPAHAARLHELNSVAAVRAFAEEIDVSPGIVVGRMQHDKLIGYGSPWAKHVPKFELPEGI